MKHATESLVAIAIVSILFALAPGDLALLDDLEDDYWLPFTHVNLGNRASAGYSSAVAHSGARSFHVEIHGWAVRDWGSAYGYASYATRGSPVTEMRVSLLFDRLEDLSRSQRDAFAAGVSLELLDVKYRSVATLRYVVATAGDHHGGTCGRASKDVVLASSPTLSTWLDLGRNPAADFPSAPWRSAEYVRTTIGFLCGSGLTGAFYSMYFDDFMMVTGAGDSDRDGIGDLEEETRFYASRLGGSGPATELPSAGFAEAELDGPAVAGISTATALSLEIDHDRPKDLALTVEFFDGIAWRSQLLWDPGFHARGAAILSPVHEEGVRGLVVISGRISARVPGSWVHLFVDNHWERVGERAENSFEIPWVTGPWTDGPHTLRVVVAQQGDPGSIGVSSPSIRVVLDRTPPTVDIVSPAGGAVLRGLAMVEAQAFDDQRLESVELRFDGAQVGLLQQEPFTFLYDTRDLANGGHTLEIRARDVAGNEAMQSMRVKVDNRGSVILPRCKPACKLASTGGGTVPPPSLDPTVRRVSLASGDSLTFWETFQVPWHPGVTGSGRTVSLVLDVLRDRSVPETDGLVGSEWEAADVLRAQSWRVLVHDYGSGSAGLLRSFELLTAARTSPGSPDTDGDGIADGAERLSYHTSPIHPNSDDDGIRDGIEITPRLVAFVIDGQRIDRIVATNPLDPDTDHDGLLDSIELAPAEPDRASDPRDADTDDDGLLDGEERLRYGSDPTLTDSDGDTLTDFGEVTPRTLMLVVDGVSVARPVVTSPTAADTDGDGLRDDEEWDGASRFGFRTDPSNPDTDRDGLSDFDEFAGLNRKPTNPLVSDTDGDGVIDGLDLSPTEFWEFPWKTTFDPGLVRFTQRFKALGVHGVSATIWTYRISDGSCVFLSDHTSEATRSSDESTANVLSVVNDVLVKGGEMNFTATTAEDMGQESWGTAASSYGACDLLAPRQYRFEYIHDSHRFDIAFVNTEDVIVRDSAGEAFSYTTLDIPLRLSMHQSVVVQVSIRPEADRGEETSDGKTTVPAFVYSLFKGSDYAAAPPFYQNLAVGAALDDHAYEFHLRIPKDVAREANTILVDGVPTVTMVLMPVWLTSDGVTVTKASLKTSFLSIGATIARVQETAELIIARLATNMAALEAVLPTSADGLATGYTTFGAFSVFVDRIGDPFDSIAPETVDAVYLVGESPEELATFQETIRWAPEGSWIRRSEDGFGLSLAIFKIIRRGISLTSQLTAAMLVPLMSTPSGSMEQMTFGRSTFVVTKLTNIETGQPYYVIGATAVQTMKLRVPHPEIPGVTLTEVRVIERELPGEIVDSLDDSRLLTGVKYANLRLALRGAAVGATVAVFGTQAILAYRDGDFVKGTVFALAGATATFGVVKSDVILARELFKGRFSKFGLRVRFGVAATIAVTGILASYELYQAGLTTDSLKRLAHFEGAGSIVFDSIVAAVPVYGAAAMLGWQLGLTITVGAAALVGIMPDSLSLKIVSTPGTAVAFLFEYVFASEIPSGVAEDALTQLLNFLAGVATYNNALDPPIPTILLVP